MPAFRFHAIIIRKDGVASDQMVAILEQQNCRVTIANPEVSDLSFFTDPASLVICDIDHAQSLAALERLKQAQRAGALRKEVPIIVTSPSRKRSVLLRARRLGCDEYILKPIDCELFAEIVRYRLQGANVSCAKPELGVQLTPREVEALTLVARGKRTADIAKTLNVSERTVNFHVVNAMHKMNVATRAEAAVRASMLGVLPPVD
jgi:DNA-binding NarL/FixJ family response regulator